MPTNVRLLFRGSADTTPAGQLTTNDDAILVGSEIDTAFYSSLSYTIRVATNGVTWTIFGADVASYADEVVVQAAAPVAVGAVGSYSIALAVFRHYRIKIKSTVGGNHGTATIVGHCKV